MMQYEDLRSYCVKKEAFVDKLRAEIANLQEKLQVQRDENNKLDAQIDKLEKDIENEQEAYKDLKRDANELRLSNSIKDRENETLQKSISDQAVRISELVEEAKEA